MNEHLVARIMLLSVVSTKAATPCHQIQSRQINLGSVVCRSIHSTAHDLAKPSSQRCELIRSVPFPTRLDQHFFLQRPLRSPPTEVGDVRRMRWSTTPSLRERPWCVSCRDVSPPRAPSASDWKSASLVLYDVRRLKERCSHDRVADLADTPCRSVSPD